MKNKFLEFNGRIVFFLDEAGTYWIAIRPICTALKLDYSRQFHNLKKNPFLGPLCSNQLMTAANGKVCMMVSLPEKYIYGWLLGIRSKNKNLLKYKAECYGILYDRLKKVSF